MTWLGWFSRKNKGSSAATATAPAIESEYTQRRLGWLRGRRHMVDAPYMLPVDDQEINRLDFQHYMLRYLLRGNYVAPIGSPLSILDVGSGTGRWATEMALAFPRANIVATDVVANPQDQPGAAVLANSPARPENYMFVPGDLLKGLPFETGSFDFVHMRLLLFAIPAQRWPDAVAELVRVTKPGGWIEMVETGPQQGGGPAMEQLVQWISRAMQYRGVDPLIGPRVGDFLQAAGVPHVERRQVGVEVNRYAGRLGALAETDVFAVMSGVKAPLVQAGIVNEQEFNAALTAAQRDISRVRCTLPFYVFYGQRA